MYSRFPAEKKMIKEHVVHDVWKEWIDSSA